jgi:hypothetical protein
MKFFRLINYLALFVTVITVPLLADEDVLRPHGRPDGGGRNNLPVYIGIEGGLNFNMYSGNVTFNNDPTLLSPSIIPTTYELMENGDGISPHFGVFVDFAFTKNIGVQLRFAYDIKYYGNSGTGIDYSNQLPFTVMPLGIDWNVTADYYTITPLFRYNFNENFLMTVGPTFHFLKGNTSYKSDVEPNGVTPNVLWQQFFDDSFHPDFQESSRIGLEIGVGYKFPIAKKIFLVPQARFQLMLTKTHQDYMIWTDSNANGTFESDEVILSNINDRMQHSIQLALALMFEL